MPDFSHINAELLLFALLVVIFILQLVIYFGFFYKLVPHKSTVNKESLVNIPVSVIICARNEGDNLTEFLPKIMTQNYPTYEVIVVNDCSTDNTEDVLREYKKVFEPLKSVVVKQDNRAKHGKKLAVMLGVKAATHEHLLFTDADCVPNSENWIMEMMQGFSTNKEIVLGYGPYFKKPGFLNKLIRYDVFLIALQYLSLAIKNKPYMGVGRNLAYKKDLFFKNKGFVNHYHLISGDDDLFINQVATNTNTSVAASANSFTYSIPKKTFKQWWEQKLRHLTTAPLYTNKTKSNLLFFYIVNYLFHATAIVCLFIPKLLIITLITWFLKLLIQHIVYRAAMKKLEEKDLLPFILIFDLLLLFIYPLLQLNRKFIKSSRWKV